MGSAVPATELRAKVGARVAHLVVGRGKVNALAVSPNGTTLVVGSEDGSVSVFAIDPLKDDLAATLVGVIYPGKLQAVREKPKKRMCDDSDEDGDEDGASPDPPPTDKTTAALQNSIRKTSLGGHEGAVTGVAMCPGGASFFTGSRDFTVKQWALPSLQLVRTFEQRDSADQDDVLAVLLSPDGVQLYTAGEDTCLTTWVVATGEVVSRIYQGRVSGKASAGEVEDDEDGEKPDEYARRREPSPVQIEEAEATRREKITSTRAKGAPNWIQCLAGAPDAAQGALIFTGSRDHAVRRWNVDTQSCERAIPGHTAPVTALAMSADGSELLSGGGRGDGTLRHYRWLVAATHGGAQDWENGKPKVTGGAYTRVRTLTGSGSNKGSAKGGRDRDVGGDSSGPAHPGGVAALAISADERFVYSGGRVEGAVKQWSIETGEIQVSIPRAHPGGVTAMALLPEAAGSWAVAAAAAAARGGRLVTGGADGCVNVWSVDAHDAVAGATLAARTLQLDAAAAATEHQRQQLRAARRTPELSRQQVTAKAQKDLPGIERAKFPLDPTTGASKDLEDMNAADLAPLTSAELITVCLAHGLMCVDLKRPPPTRQDIAATMVAFFEEEKEKSRATMREERVLRRTGPS